MSDAIDVIRRKYDPSSCLIRSHITVRFPIPDRVGEEPLIQHIDSVLNEYCPFEITLGGSYKSRDQRLFLTLEAGNAQVKQLYRALFSGRLAEFGGNEARFVPHLGLGLFLKTGAVYDWRNPRESDFDRERFDTAMRHADELPLPERVEVDSLHLSRISDQLIEWTTGKRADFPEGPAIFDVREFQLVWRSA